MKTNATKTTKTIERNQRRTLEQISRQVEMALTSDKTPDGVKDCLKTIIFEASNEAGLLLGEILQDDFSRVRATFPSIIEKLGVSLRRVQQLIELGTLPAQRIGRDYLIQEKDLSSITIHGKAGRPKKVVTEKK